MKQNTTRSETVVVVISAARLSRLLVLLACCCVENEWVLELNATFSLKVIISRGSALTPHSRSAVEKLTFPPVG